VCVCVRVCMSVCALCVCCVCNKENNKEIIKKPKPKMIFVVKNTSYVSGYI